MNGTKLPPLDIPDLLRRHELRPRKGLGQNYLQERTALEKIVTSANLTTSDAVLEIGPGLGSLTRDLAQRARSVTAVELDEKLLPVLREVLAPFPNVRLIHGDILALSPVELMEHAPYLVVANIPYYITSAVIRHLLGGEPRPSRVVLTVQREVGERICAIAGDLSLLALSVQVYGKPEITATIPAEAFYPTPQVSSVVVRVEIFPQPLIHNENLERFFQLAKAGFSQKRKTLRNALSGGLRIPPDQAATMLRAAGIDPQRRAETLNLEEWGKLAALPGT
jgi:16S rRNA (adenine1518-N6/adenine1519-N6)-dimethyltransferase